MDTMFEVYFAHEQSFLEADEIPPTKDPVWILGKSYNSKDREHIKRDILSRLWFSYRKGFIPIGESGLTSDKGWGCMLRCGQMLIAQALLFLHLGREWCWSPTCQDLKYLKILRMFEDRVTACYSIHKIALEGANEGKEVGSWFGPNTVVQVLKKLSVLDEWSKLMVHVAMDNTLVVNDVKRLCKYDQAIHGKTRHRWKPLLLVIPLRLGIHEINPVYITALKMCFTFPQSLGVIGGKPNHALYFIGSVGNSVVYLDPHTTQSIGIVDGKDQEHEKKTDSSYHYQQISRINISQMDPSVAIGFLCKNEAEFDHLVVLMKERLMSEKQCLFELREEAQADWPSTDVLGSCSTYYTDQSIYCDDSDEDFEILG